MATSDSKDKKISEVPHLENVTGVEKIPVSAAGGESRYIEVKQIVEKAGSNAVKLTGNQTIEGIKTFKGGIAPIQVEGSNLQAYMFYKGPTLSLASCGYYSGLAFVANDKSYGRIGVMDDGTPVYRKSATTQSQTLLHEGNYKDYVEVPIVPVTEATIEAETGKYYRVDEPVETLAIRLPDMTAQTLMLPQGQLVMQLPNAHESENKGNAEREYDEHTIATLEADISVGTTLEADAPMAIAATPQTECISALEVLFTTGDAPQVTIEAEGGAEVDYFAGYSIEPNTTYELNIMWNGAKWIVAYAVVE